MKRGCRLAAAVGLALVLVVGSMSATTLILSRFPQTNPAQVHSEWCWAGSSQAVLAYYGKAVSQCAIANYATGYPEVAGRTDCCATSSFSDGDTTGTCSTSCNCWNYMWGDSGWNVTGRSLQGILSHWGVNSTATGAALTQAVTASEVNASRPVVIRFGWACGASGTSATNFTCGGHFLAIYGQEQDGAYVDYWDPLPGHGATRGLYTAVAQTNGDHQWTHTLKLTTSPPSAPPTFTDDPLVARTTPVRAGHITELRAKVDTLRARYGLPVFSWTDTLSAGSSRVKAIHVNELRTALQPVFTAAGRLQPSYMNPVLTAASSVVTKQDVAEIRTAIVGIW
jgi:hypothetical protein